MWRFDSSLIVKFVSINLYWISDSINLQHFLKLLRQIIDSKISEHVFLKTKPDLAIVATKINTANFPPTLPWQTLILQETTLRDAWLSQFFVVNFSLEQNEEECHVWLCYFLIFTKYVRHRSCFCSVTSWSWAKCRDCEKDCPEFSQRIGIHFFNKIWLRSSAMIIIETDFRVQLNTCWDGIYTKSWSVRKCDFLIS